MLLTLASLADALLASYAIFRHLVGVMGGGGGGGGGGRRGDTSRDEPKESL